MYYKQDWEKSKKRLLAFWNGEVIDRCCISVTAPRKNSQMHLYNAMYDIERFDDDDIESIKRWWTDPEDNYKRTTFYFENTYFGGEAIPITAINWGAMAEAAFYGSKPIFNKKSVWYPQVIENLSSWEWKFDKENNEYWKIIKEITKYFIEKNDGRYFVGIAEMGTAGDILSLMRGMDNLCLDLLDYPEEVKGGINIISDTWIELHEEIYHMTLKSNDYGGVLSWMHLWAPGRIDQLACDFSWVISPEMFKEFFVPEIIKVGRWAEYGTYHLDGPACIRNHLDTLLEIDEIKTIQWTPGAGCPPTYYPQYIPKYKKIQESGKNLYLLADIKEVEPILSELSPRGLFIRTQAESEEEADELLKKAEKWSQNKIR